MRLIFNDGSSLTVDQVIEVFTPENKEQLASSSLIIFVQDPNESSLDLGERFSEEAISVVKVEKNGRVIAAYEGYSLDNISHRISNIESVIEITLTSVIYPDRMEG